ncbi:MAG TPA: HAMP domain-containing sensor histidine kinase, partial [Acidimicrobiia bacterium]|nr:HAMP domain-containing sensor histidine kinase [Acidimicrobiia bacterium]
MAQASRVEVDTGTLVPPRPPRLRLGLLAFGALSVLASLTVVVAAPEAALEVAPVGVMLGGAVAGTAFILGARVHRDRERLAWSVIGAGMILAAVGVLVVGLIDTLSGPAPAFGWHDLIFIGAYGTVIVGFSLMPNLGSVLTGRVRVLLDGLIGASTMAVIIWVFFADGLRLHLLESATFWEQFAGVAYPLLDSAMVVAAMIVTIRRSSWRFDGRVALIGLGMVLQALADLNLLSTGVGEAFVDSNPNFALFLIAMLCYLGSAAMVERRPQTREYADRRQPLWSLVAPYGAAGIAVWLVVIEVAQAALRTNHVILLLLGLAVVSLVVGRQLVALRDFRNLVEERRRALVSSVSHELRTPLTAMVGFLDVMKDPEVSMPAEERQELIGVVHQQAMYMSRIVADLLLLARDSAGPELHESVVALDKVVANSVFSGRSSPVGLEVEVEPGLYAYLDPDRIRQVLDNLVTNAIRYGHGQVVVTAASRQNDVVVEVHDDGPGVPRKYEIVIWEQFERGPNRLNSNVPGSGIGLAVVDRIVRRHGGQVAY